MKKTIAVLLITASSILADVVIPLPQWQAMSAEEQNRIISQVNANNLAEQNRILERQTAIMREQLEIQRESQESLERSLENKKESPFDF